MLARGVYLPPSAFEAWFVSTAIDDAAATFVASAHVAARSKRWDVRMSPPSFRADALPGDKGPSCCCCGGTQLY
jgi:glutamate-1-semialdehyde 2,1-aminomutase